MPNTKKAHPSGRAFLLVSINASTANTKDELIETPSYRSVDLNIST